jgi:hypothetical protein
MSVNQQLHAPTTAILLFLPAQLIFIIVQTVASCVLGAAVVWYTMQRIAGQRYTLLSIFVALPIGLARALVRVRLFSCWPARSAGTQAAVPGAQAAMSIALEPGGEEDDGLPPELEAGAATADPGALTKVPPLTVDTPATQRGF